jgi:hypothetical protein
MTCSLAYRIAATSIVITFTTSQYNTDNMFLSVAAAKHLFTSSKTKAAFLLRHSRGSLVRAN